MGLGDRVRGGLYGALVGDALGVPYEFHAAADLPPAEAIEMVPPAGFPRAHPGTPPGTWSDDGAQALALLDSLLTCGRLDLDDLGRRFVRWHAAGDYTPDGVVFDVGLQTRSALAALARGGPSDGGPAGVWDNGNGALMRVLPLVLWHAGDDAALVRDAARQGLPTHGHPRSQACCGLYVLWARDALQCGEAPFARAVARFREVAADRPDLLRELDDAVLPAFDEAPGGTGYVVDALRSAVWAVEGARDHADAVRRAIGLGEDTDTTACIAGGVAGLLWGEAGIPERWRETLRGRDLVEGLLARLSPPVPTPPR